VSHVGGSTTSLGRLFQCPTARGKKQTFYVFDQIFLPVLIFLFYFKVKNDCVEVYWKRYITYNFVPDTCVDLYFILKIHLYIYHYFFIILSQVLFSFQSF